MLLSKPAITALSAIGLVLGLAYSAEADVLPVTNLQFNNLTNPLTQQKDFFTVVQPVGWSIGAAAQIDNLIYVGQQGSESFSDQSHGNIYGVYSNPGFSNTVPPGTNFYQADGNPQFESTIFQTVSGLTAGTTYTLQFQQAAGQQVGFTGDTTEQWKVFLGVGGIGVNCSTNPCTITGTANNIEMDSPLMSTPSGHNTDWNNVNLSFTPTAADLTGGSAILTFLAWGDGGSTTNLPPTVFLEGVNTPPTVPEPTTLSLLGVGLAGFGGAIWRRRAKGNAAV
jgi:PEP-CTERM motif-containing protein